MVVKQLGESNFHAFSIQFHRIPIQMQCACSRDSVLFLWTYNILKLIQVWLLCIKLQSKMYNAPKVYTSILVTDTLKITEPFGLQWWITIEQWLINCSFMKSSHKLSSCSPSISSSVHSDLITRMDFFCTLSSYLFLPVLENTVWRLSV